MQYGLDDVPGAPGGAPSVGGHFQRTTCVTRVLQIRGSANLGVGGVSSGEYPVKRNCVTKLACERPGGVVRPGCNTTRRVLARWSMLVRLMWRPRSWCSGKTHEGSNVRDTTDVTEVLSRTWRRYYRKSVGRRAATREVWWPWSSCARRRPACRRAHRPQVAEDNCRPARTRRLRTCR